jgi:serine/threonine-protein kinase
VGGWLLVQIATQVFPFFDISNAAVRWVVIAVAAGFPAALVLAWLFDITPEGIVRTPDLPANGDVPVAAEWRRTMDRKLNYLLGALLVAALSLVGYDHLHADDGDSAKPSIAVLPLVGEGGDASNEYFSDGLSEELIAALAQISQLKVIGRNSSFRFKGSNEDSSSIGEKLKVSTLLEGTVRRQGDQVRIVAELIHAADGRELWSHTYDRQLKDIFAVQAEIAAAVAESLKVTLLGGNVMAQTSGQTANADAHNAYLQAHFLFARLNRDDYLKANHYYDEAIRLDPNYALAYAERSEAWTWLADWAIDPAQVGPAKAAARADAQKAVELGPDLAEAHAALGWVLFFSDWKFQEGLTELLRAQQLAPNNATVNELLSRVLLYMGRGKEAEGVARHSIDIDPLTFKAHENLARILFAQGRLQESDAEGRKAVEIQPTASASRRWQVFAAVMRHDDAAALTDARAEPAEGYRVFELALVQARGTDRVAADAALKDLVSRTGLAYQIAEVYAWRGDIDLACVWLQRAYDQHDTGILSAPFDPFLKPLHGDARYEALRKQLGLPDPAW